MKKIFSVLIIAFIICTIFAGCSSTKKDKLIVGMELAYPPFEMKDSAGNPSGVSVDIAKAFGAYIGKDVEIVNTAWEGLIPSLKTGKVDMVISSMTIREDRAKEVDFSNPYANSFLAILANRNSNIKSISDLNQKGKKVAVKTGSTGHLYAIDHLKNAEVIVLADESACVMEVSQGKADGFLYDQLTIYRDWQDNLNTTTAIFIPFQDVEHWAIAVKKGNTQLLEQFNTFLKQYTADGEFDKLSEKYLPEEKKAFDNLGFKWFFDLK